MKRVVFLLLLGLMAALLVQGCQKEADAKVVCSSCNLQVDKSQATQKDGAWICKNCEAKAAAAAQEKTEAQRVDCAGGCGMKLDPAEAQLIDGKYYCAGCAVLAQGKAQSQDPPPGTEAF